MLSLAKLGVGAEGYYLDSVARGTEEYYFGSGEAPGRWLGASPPSLGLEGEVGADDLRAILSGLDPTSGERLAPVSRRVPGFDLTFSAPKSVSLMHALGAPAVRVAVVDAHEAAVDAALGYLEREACRLRRGHAGAEVIPGAGFVAAGFRHRTSRAGDPQLHTHVLVANMARGEDERWGSLDARHLYRHARTAGYLYQAQLRANLSRSLGISWAPAHKGMAEIADVPAAVLRAFSQRRVAIEAELARTGNHTRKGTQLATLLTRGAKQHVELPELRELWRQQLTEAGGTIDQLQGVGSARARLLVGSPTRGVTRAAHEIAAELTKSDSTFDRQHVIRAWAERARAGADVDRVERLAGSLLRSDEAVEVSPGRYSTPAHLRLEQRLLDTVAGRLDECCAVVPARQVSTVLGRHAELSEEQRAMVRRLTTAGHGVDVVIGYPGSGKTHALRAAAEAWRSAGIEPIGAALAARAALQLEEGAGISSQTLRSLLTNGLTSRLTARSVIVLDEAGMVGTRDVADLVEAASRAGAKVVLVGDPKQLPEIDAGGAFRVLARRLEAVKLTDNHRQTLAAERAALLDLRAGRPRLAVARLASIGHLTTTDTLEHAEEAIIERWRQLRADGHDVLAMAHRRRDVDTLNRLAQRIRVDANEVGPQHLEVGRQRLYVGDDVLITKNDRRLGVINGQRGTIRGIDTDAITVGGADHEVRLPLAFVNQHMKLGYAATIHKGQGATSDQALLLVTDGVELEAAYTGASRGRTENHLYVCSHDLNRLTHQLSQSAAKDLASENDRRR